MTLITVSVSFPKKSYNFRKLNLQKKKKQNKKKKCKQNRVRKSYKNQIQKIHMETAHLFKSKYYLFLT